MAQISLTPQSGSLKVHLVDSIDNLEQKGILEQLGFTGEYKQTALLPEIGLLFIGTKRQAKVKSTDPYFKVNYFELGAKLSNTLSKTKLENVELYGTFGSSKDLEFFVLGALQGAWKFDKYLKHDQPSFYERLNIGLNESVAGLWNDDLAKSVKVLDEALLLTRRIVEDTPEVINPKSMPELIEQELGGNDHISIRRINRDEMEKMGMEGILMVGRGSRYEPVLMHTVLKPRGEVKHRICLVGKGLTYDSGGYNIKPNGGQGMKADMAGSASVFGVMKALSGFGLENTEVHWISSFAENLIDGSAYKPDDILTSYSGQTIEIWNTDAEGRLTLADGLAYATLQNPDFIIDIATLTGAAVVAVSEYYTALMGNDEALINAISDVALIEQEMTVHTRMPEALREKVHGELSDLVNTSTIGRYAGHLTAGLFLSHFVDQNLFRNPDLNITEPKAFAWAHLDIAPSSHNKKQNDLETDGATGQSVRTLISWVQSVDQA